MTPTEPVGQLVTADALVKAGWKGGTLQGGYLCPVKDCGRTMSLHLLDDHLTSSLFGGHGLTVEWTIRVSEEVPLGVS